MNYLCVADENISLEAYVQVLGFWFVKVDIPKERLIKKYDTSTERSVPGVGPMLPEAVFELKSHFKDCYLA